MPITKVISGGQTGVDQGGIIGAARAGVETGGWMPYGYLTENGEARCFARKYGLKECDCASSIRERYAIRTGRNVFDSDGTVCIARDFNSPGELCTKRAILRHNKASVHLPFTKEMQQHIADGMLATVFTYVDSLATWIKNENICTLNVAGNRESNAPGIAKFTEELIYNLIQAVNNATSH